jgi:hypothetical protein
LEALGEGLKCSLSFRIKGTMCEDLTLWMSSLNVRSPAYLP